MGHAMSWRMTVNAPTSSEVELLMRSFRTRREHARTSRHGQGPPVARAPRTDTPADSGRADDDSSARGGAPGGAPGSPPGSPPGPPQRPPTAPTPAQRPPSPPARAQHDPNHFGDDGSALERIMGRLREVSHEVQHARTSVMRASAAAQDGLPGMGAFVF